MNRYKGGYQIIKLNDIVVESDDTLSEENLIQFEPIIKNLKENKVLKPLVINFKDDDTNIISAFFNGCYYISDEMITITYIGSYINSGGDYGYGTFTLHYNVIDGLSGKYSFIIV